MKIRKNILPRIALHTFLIVLSLTYILPLILMISISISSEEAIMQYGYSLFPKVISLDGFRQALAKPHQIIQSYKVTFAFSMLSTFLAMIVQSFGAYPLSRANFKYKKQVTIYLFITMLFSGGLVPSYILNTQYLRLNNTFWIYIFPSLTNVWNVIVFRTFFQGLPTGLAEAAKIDGASETRTFLTIILPLSTPVFASLGFMSVLAKWNDWNTSLLYIKNSELYSLQYLLQRILREVEFVQGLADEAQMQMAGKENLPTETMRYAMAILAAGPMMVVFPFFQKYFAKGITVGSVKG